MARAGFIDNLLRHGSFEFNPALPRKPIRISYGNQEVVNRKAISLRIRPSDVTRFHTFEFYIPQSGDKKKNFRLFP